MKSGNLNFLEPSGPLQACNRTALPLPSIVNFRTVSSSGFWIARNTEFCRHRYCCHFVIIVITVIMLAQYLSISVVLDLLLFIWGNFTMIKHRYNVNLNLTCIVYYWMKEHNIKVEVSENKLILLLWIQKLSADFYSLYVTVPIRLEFNVSCDKCEKLYESKRAASHKNYFIFTHAMWCQI